MSKAKNTAAEAAELRPDGVHEFPGGQLPDHPRGYQQALYPAMGQTVEYVRSVPDGIERGKGVILGLALDGAKRLAARIEIAGPEGKQLVNVHMPCINPTPEFVDRFEAACVKVQTLSAEGGKIVEGIVADYNQRIEDVQSSVMGEVTKPDSIDAPTPAPAEELE